MRHALIRVGVVLALAACAGTSPGCSTTGDDNAEENAMRIAKLLADAKKVIPEIRDEGAKLPGGMDPDVALKKLRNAEAQMEEARKLSPESHSPRQVLAEILHASGAMYVLKRESLADRIKEFEDRKESPPKNLVEEKAKANEQGTLYFRRAIQELTFYLDHMANRDQQWELKAWDLLHSCYFFLGDWRNAAGTLRAFVRHFEKQMTPQALAHNRELIRRYEAQELDEAE